MDSVIRVLRWLTPFTLMALAVCAGCGSPESRAAEAAENTSELAASAKQKQLWQDAADKGHAPGLERVPTVQNPVEQRKPPSQPGTSTPVPPQAVTIPPDVPSSIRILDFPPDPGKGYEGPATVVDVAGDRVHLDLGAKRILTVLARAGGRPIRLSAGETVSVTYLQRRGPRDQRTAIGILTANGFGIVQTAESSTNPVDLNVPLFNVNAKQRGSDPAEGVRIIAGPGLAPQDLKLGEIRTIGGVTVFVVGSAGIAKGAPAVPIEGRKPYALNVMVWKVP